MALAQYTKRSPPFELIVLAPHNATLNGSTLDACHEGAAIEGFCRGPQITSTPSYGSSFYFNTSTSNSNSKASDVQGVLSYDLVIADNTTVPSSMYLVDTWTSNVAVPILSPGYDPVTEVYFDAQDFMYILSTQDDTVSPAGQKQEKVKQWYVCTTYYGYTYDTLAWTVGKRAKPQNPTCQKVEVKRVWV
ncbi:hypothetical protein K491DRAFT_692931 [Lophiostoma macrostomum CBS 122681]|uniref:DUF7907 domain-containing protein n=1 Tax=Lophiostoma macrostomum CBS 122681 TaxID=1314788 RepID=A0A6A6T6T7_9PLEO|nr:hypothetical protein K491DRAFT_692931 [Lophiostoma macrostomum CBS 122681]